MASQTRALFFSSTLIYRMILDETLQCLVMLVLEILMRKRINRKHTLVRFVDEQYLIQSDKSREWNYRRKSTTCYHSSALLVDFYSFLSL